MSKSPDDSPPPKRPKKKRRWAKILGVLLLLFAGLLLLVNGPIARWFVAKTIREKLAEQGLTGDLKVEGRLHSGLTLREARFTGTGDIEQLSFDEIGVRYWILDLLDKKVERISIKNLVATVTLRDKPKPEKKEGINLPDLQKIGDTLRKIRPLVLPIEIDIEGLDLTGKRPGKEPLKLKLGALQHTPGADTFTIQQLRSNALGEKGLPTQDLVLTWEPERIGLGRAEVLPELAVDFLSIALPVGGTASVETMVAGLASELRVRADASGKVHLELADKPLDLSKLTYLPDLELKGTIETLVVDLEHMLAPMAEWRGTINLSASGLVWPKGELQSVKADVVLGDEISVTLDASGDLHLEATARHPAEKSDDPKQWLENLVVAFDVTAPSLHTALQHIMPAAGKAVPELAKIPEGALGAKGEVTLGGEKVVSAAQAEWSFSKIVYQEESVPDIAGTAALETGTAKATVTLAQPRPEESLEIGGEFNLEAKTYTASVKAALPDPAWFLPFLPKQEDPLWKPTGPLAMEWNGSGELSENPVHRGALNLSKLALTAPEDTRTDIELQANYAWPGMVEATSLSVRNGDLWLEGALKWNEDRLTISALHLDDATGPVTSLHGALPLKLDALAPKDYLQQEGALDLALEGRDLRLARLAKLLPLKLPEGFAATLQYNLKIGGTPSAPTLGGTFSATGVDVPGPEQLPLLDVNLTFATTEQRLSATGSVTEPDGKLVELSASLPLQPKVWVDDPGAFKELPIQATALINDFKLQRLARFVPALKEAEGSIAVDVRVSGTVAKPDLAGGATLKLDRYPLKNTPYREVRNSSLVLRLDGDRVVIEPTSNFNCSGGKLLLSGAVALVDNKPVFDLQLDADHLLVWRNDSFILRSNGRINIDGPLAAARVSGQLEIVESLFYQDFDLIPLGVPTATVPKPKLPQIDQAQTNKIGGIPDPFGNWTLDLVVKTGDPVLIRGNVATGEVSASTRITGTLSDPRPSGTINLSETKIPLPHSSSLFIDRGIVTLRPESAFNPVLDIRGTSVIDRTNVTLNLYGPVSGPKYTLFSDPPLPESELLTLLATGATTGDLEDRDTASMKALQLLANELRRRYSNPGSTSVLQRALDGLDAVELNVGENDPFSGRKFNSATLKISKQDRWFVSAAVDATGNSRGLVIYSVRFR